MKKGPLFFLLIVLAAALVVWVGCTTQQAVEEPADQTSALNVISAKWAGSAHADASSEAFMHWNEDDPAEIPPTCAKCHSATGFQDYIGADGSAVGSVEAAGPIVDPINCAACHNDAADLMEQAVLPNGTVLEDIGRNALCSTCHSGMGSSAAVQNVVADQAEDEVLPDQGIMGAHYLLAASVHAGADGGVGFEYEGMSYAGKFFHAEAVNSCLECHDPHSLRTQKPENTDANLCSTCHSDVTSYQDYKSISMCPTDYDGDGTKESTYEELEGLKAKLIEAMRGYSNAKSGVTFGFYKDAYPYAFIDTNNDGAISEDEAAFPNQFKAFTPRLLKAAFNLMFVAKDPAAYVHNPDYAFQLLYDSIEDLSEFSGVSTQGLVRP